MSINSSLYQAGVMHVPYACRFMLILSGLQRHTSSVPYVYTEAAPTRHRKVLSAEVWTLLWELQAG